MIKTLLREELRFLTFRQVSSVVPEHWKAFLVFGLAFTWLAGVGRYWDNPRASWWQHLGLGSVAYVFVLAAILWFLVLPLRPSNWRYRNVLLFVTLTAPPAVLYAIPVERFLSAGAAQAVNAWFLGVVAAWRLALYAVFLRRSARLRVFPTIIATLLPMALIVTALAVLNLEHVVFNLMSGIDPSQSSPNDTSFGVVVALSFYSVLASPVLALGYLLCVSAAILRARREKTSP